MRGSRCLGNEMILFLSSGGGLGTDFAFVDVNELSICRRKDLIIAIDVYRYCRYYIIFMIIVFFPRALLNSISSH